jgi:hypothetical protein
LSEVLLRGEPELDTAVFKNDHERVGVTRVQIATVHVKLPVESLHFGSALFAEKTGDRTVRGTFQFLIGLLINFHEPLLKNGISRMIVPGANQREDESKDISL